MAEEEAPLHTGLPNPPAYFYQDFTPERIERMKQLRREYKDATGSEPPPRLPELPEDLINLQPPAEPADGKWRVFHQLYTLEDKLPSLEEQSIPRLIPEPPAADDPAASKDSRVHSDRALVLKRLSKSLLLNFVELTGILSVAPEQGAEKQTDIHTLLTNMHHAINEYRPHQAREQVIELLQSRLDDTRAETAAVRAATDRCRRTLEGLGSLDCPPLEELLAGHQPEGGAADVAKRKALERERERSMWAAMDAAPA